MSVLAYHMSLFDFNLDVFDYMIENLGANDLAEVADESCCCHMNVHGLK